MLEIWTIKIVFGLRLHLGSARKSKVVKSENTTSVFSSLKKMFQYLCFMKEQGAQKWLCTAVNIRGHAVTIRYIDPCGACNSTITDVDSASINPYQGQKGTRNVKACLRAAHNAIYKVGSI